MYVSVSYAYSSQYTYAYMYTYTGVCGVEISSWLIRVRQFVADQSAYTGVCGVETIWNKRSSAAMTCIYIHMFTNINT